MPSRYTAKPARAEYWHDDLEMMCPDPVNPTVWDEGAEPTGVLDAHGNEYHRLPERIGFIRD